MRLSVPRHLSRRKTAGRRHNGSGVGDAAFYLPRMATSHFLKGRNAGVTPGRLPDATWNAAEPESGAGRFRRPCEGDSSRPVSAEVALPRPGSPCPRYEVAGTAVPGRERVVNQGDLEQRPRRGLMSGGPATAG